MPEKTLNEVFSEIADAIREKSESSETIKPINMAAAIEEIPTGPSLDNDSLYTVDGSGSPTKVAGNACVVTTESGSPVIRSDVHSGYYYSTVDNEQDHALDFEQLEANTYINGFGSTRTLDIHSTYYVSGESGGDAKFLASGYYHIIDGDSNEPSMLEGLDGEGYYQFDGDYSFSGLNLVPGNGYYMQGDMPYPIRLPNNWEYAGGSIVTLNLPYEEGQTYTYVNRDEGQIPFVSYTPGPTPEKGKYYYGNALNAQTLNSETLYWKGDGDNISLDPVQLTAGSTYTWNGHSFIPYTPETDALDALMQETF